MTADPVWLTQPERGSRRLMHTIAVIALRVGRPVGRLLLYPICAYFILFSSRARRASRDYLRRVLGVEPAWRDIFRHYHCFAATILDRPFLLTGRFAPFQFEIVGIDELMAAIAPTRGCLLVGAHFGSFEVLRMLGQSRAPVRVRVLMHEQNAAKLNSVLGALNPQVMRDIITLGRPQTMLEVRDAVAAGEIVGLLADRVVAGDRLAACSFLGETAQFPQGPFVLAGMLKAPVVLFSGACLGNGRYQIRFTALTTTAPLDSPRVATGQAALAAQCQDYARWLEDNCRAAPYNWFNFYDFWAPAAQT